MFFKKFSRRIKSPKKKLGNFLKMDIFKNVQNEKPGSKISEKSELTR